MKRGKSFDLLPLSARKSGPNRQWFAVLSGDFLEITTKPSYCFLEHANPHADSVRGATEESEESIRNRVRVRAQQAVRRLVNSNRLTKMWTLTFAVDPIKGFDFDIVPFELQKNRDYVLALWKRFVRKCRSYLDLPGGKLRYVAVLEKHLKKTKDERKRGTYHFHFATDVWVEKAELQRLWSHGTTWVEDFTKPRKAKVDEHGVRREARGAISNPGAYMSKYISKDFAAEENTWKKKNYFSSRGLKKPVSLSTQAEIEFCLFVAKNRVFYQVSEVDLDGKTMIIEKQTWKGAALDKKYEERFFSSELSPNEIHETYQKASHSRFVDYCARNGSKGENDGGCLFDWNRYREIEKARRSFLRNRRVHNFHGHVVKEPA